MHSHLHYKKANSIDTWTNVNFSSNMDKSFELRLERALQEVDKDLSLPGNSLVNTTSNGIPPAEQFPSIRRIEAKVHLDKHFLVDVNDKFLKHSRKLKLRKENAVQYKEIDVLTQQLHAVIEE